jgi:hypothetical protein
MPSNNDEFQATDFTISLGRGRYNRVARTDKPFELKDSEGHTFFGQLVCKSPCKQFHAQSVAMPKSTRARRVFTEINPDLPTASLGDDWVLSYIDSKEPEDKATADKIIEIYKKTGRMVSDSGARGNFIERTSDKKIILVDVDLALRSGSPDSDAYC